MPSSNMNLIKNENKDLLDDSEIDELEIDYEATRVIL